MFKGEIKFQIGKNGLTSGIINSLELAFKNRKQVRISVLKSGTRDKEKIKQMAEEISNKLEGNTENQRHRNSRNERISSTENSTKREFSVFSVPSTSKKKQEVADYVYKIIGFTIIIRKVGSAKKKR